MKSLLMGQESTLFYFKNLYESDSSSIHFLNDQAISSKVLIIFGIQREQNKFQQQNYIAKYITIIDIVFNTIYFRLIKQISLKPRQEYENQLKIVEVNLRQL
ncbi:hypothetical protein ABPG72_011583 [Tetrahymena utriculariae]